MRSCVYERRTDDYCLCSRVLSCRRRIQSQAVWSGSRPDVTDGSGSSQSWNWIDSDITSINITSSYKQRKPAITQENCLCTNQKPASKEWQKQAHLSWNQCGISSDFGPGKKTLPPPAANETWQSYVTVDAWRNSVKCSTEQSEKILTYRYLEKHQISINSHEGIIMALSPLVSYTMNMLQQVYSFWHAYLNNKGIKLSFPV